MNAELGDCFMKADEEKDEEEEEEQQQQKQIANAKESAETERKDLLLES